MRDKAPHAGRLHRPRHLPRNHEGSAAASPCLCLSPCIILLHREGPAHGAWGLQVPPVAPLSPVRQRRLARQEKRPRVLRVLVLLDLPLPVPSSRRPSEGVEGGAVERRPRARALHTTALHAAWERRRALVSPLPLPRPSPCPGPAREGRPLGYARRGAGTLTLMRVHGRVYSSAHTEWDAQHIILVRVVLVI